MRALVLVHGRGLQGQDPETVEETWLLALRAGLQAAGSGLTVRDEDASFVSYAEALGALLKDPAATPPPVTVAAADLGDWDDDARAFALEVADDVRRAAGVRDEQVVREAVELGGLDLDDRDLGDRDLGDLGEVLAGLAAGPVLAAVLSAIDRFVPGVSAAAVLLFARDVHAYLTDAGVRKVLDDGLASALPTDEPVVVVAHSLGSVIAYSALCEHPDAARWDVPLLVTIGSPLAIRAIRDLLRERAPLRVPAPVRRWVNVRDPRDPLALHGLGPEAFPLEPGSPAITEVTVVNADPWHHAAAIVLDDEAPDGAVAGYLATPEVGGLLGRALLEG